ncbi:MAG TPA: hypothetical protein PKZ71_08355 [Chitinophagaceae bacterium]|nr:hypothetical protein [Chitinophagaceae bacterium]HNA92249.1 hypothetical protein [Chitinophagaceae bacterium]HND94915.1 hypothetical protein [Chitinophagaceae bacterium]HNF37553.1 hypothetical protein [Chitinophagaceae bacterium]HNJ26067.1 hypothetical protein [Chitinophagaceae bacterium]
MNFRNCCFCLWVFTFTSNYALSQSENFTDIFTYAGFILGKNKTELKDTFFCNNFDSKGKVPDSFCIGGLIFLSNKQLLSVNHVPFRDLILSTDSSGKIISLVLLLSSSLKDNKAELKSINKSFSETKRYLQERFNFTGKKELYYEDKYTEVTSMSWYQPLYYIRLSKNNFPKTESRKQMTVILLAIELRSSIKN